MLPRFGSALVLQQCSLFVETSLEMIQQAQVFLVIASKQHQKMRGCEKGYLVEQNKMKLKPWSYSCELGL